MTTVDVLEETRRAMRKRGHDVEHAYVVCRQPYPFRDVTGWRLDCKACGGSLFIGAHTRALENDSMGNTCEPR